MMQFQIAHSMFQGGKGGLPRDLVAFTILSRIPLIFITLFNDNIFKIEPISTANLILLILVFLFHLYII